MRVGGKRWNQATVALVLGCSAAFGQSPKFEVASVKLSEPPPPGVMFFRMGTGPSSADPGRVTYKGSTLKSLIAGAYDLKEYQVEGPQWVDNERYDVMATLPEGQNSKEQVRSMLQALLVERFRLTIHHDSKPLPVYAISVAKEGLKLKATDPAIVAAAEAPRAGPPAPPPPGGRGTAPAGGVRMMMGSTSRRITGSITIPRLCDLLTSFSDRPVVDLTGLTGTYDLDLVWTPDDNEKMGGKVGVAMMAAGAGSGADGKNATEGAGDPGLSLAQALQRNYGLKLEPKKNPVDLLVIDHAEKVPTEN